MVSRIFSLIFAFSLNGKQVDWWALWHEVDSSLVAGQQDEGRPAESKAHESAAKLVPDGKDGACATMACAFSRHCVFSAQRLVSDAWMPAFYAAVANDTNDAIAIFWHAGHTTNDAANHLRASGLFDPVLAATGCGILP
jgi:hypothetical protein